MTKKCVVCGKLFETKSSRAKTCSPDCRKEHKATTKGNYMKKYLQKPEVKARREKYVASYYEINKKSILEKNKNYRSTHREEIEANRKQNYHDNIEARRATRRAYRKKNRDKINKQQRDNSRTSEYKEKRRNYLGKKKFEFFRSINEILLGHFDVGKDGITKKVTCTCLKIVTCNGYKIDDIQHKCPHKIQAKNWRDENMVYLTLGHPDKDGAVERRKLNKGKDRRGSGWGGYAQIKKAGYPGNYAVQCRNCQAKE